MDQSSKPYNAPTTRIQKTLNHLSAQQEEVLPRGDDDASNSINKTSTTVETLIIGAGFSGLATAIELRKLGRVDVMIVDKANRVGGTWEANRYPGVECDVPSLSYMPLNLSKTFVPTMRFSDAVEIQRFMECVVDEQPGLRQRIRLNTEVKSCVWDDDTHMWTVLAHDAHRITCRFVVYCIGMLSIPHIPENIEPRFTGIRVHSAEWPTNGIDLTGKTVAIVGSGASATQLIPEIAPKVKRLVVFQRTPSYVDDKSVLNFNPSTQLFSPHTRDAFVARKRREMDYLMDEQVIRGFHEPRLAQKQRNAFLKRLEARVPDPVLRAKLTPQYAIGCKRIAYVNNYYESLQLPHVQLIAEAVKAEFEDGLETTQGTQTHGVDVIVYCTGFKSSLSFFQDKVSVRGLMGKELQPRTSGYDSLYGIHVGADYPNAFGVCGPRGFLVHVSITAVADLQAEYVAKLVDFAARNGHTKVTPHANACVEWTRTCKDLAANSVWAGCSSYYNQYGNGFVGYAGRMSTYCETLMREGYSQMDFSSSLNDHHHAKTYSPTEAPFDLSVDRRPPWPKYSVHPHEDF